MWNVFWPSSDSFRETQGVLKTEMSLEGRDYTGIQQEWRTGEEYRLVSQIHCQRPWWPWSPIEMCSSVVFLLSWNVSVWTGSKHPKDWGWNKLKVKEVVVSRTKKILNTFSPPHTWPIAAGRVCADVGKCWKGLYAIQWSDRHFSCGDPGQLFRQWHVKSCLIIVS